MGMFIKVDDFKATRVAYRCLDWSERRDHMAGQPPKALLPSVNAL
jgi:hypothetical protein